MKLESSVRVIDMHCSILGLRYTHKSLSQVQLYVHDMCLHVNETTHPSRHLTSVGRQIDVRLRRHNDVGVRLILKVCLTSKTDVNLTC